MPWCWQPPFMPVWCRPMILQIIAVATVAMMECVKETIIAVWFVASLSVDPALIYGCTTATTWLTLKTKFHSVCTTAGQVSLILCKHFFSHTIIAQTLIHLLMSLFTAFLTPYPPFSNHSINNLELHKQFGIIRISQWWYKRLNCAPKHEKIKFKFDRQDSQEWNSKLLEKKSV